MTDKTKNIIYRILISIGSFLIDILPIIITAVIALFCQTEFFTLFNEEFVNSGNLIWLGCAYMGLMFIGVFSLKKTMDAGWNLLVVLNVCGIVLGIVVYIFNKLIYFDLLKNGNKNITSIVVYITFVLLFILYIAYKVISIVCDIKILRQEEQCQA